MTGSSLVNAHVTRWRIRQQLVDGTDNPPPHRRAVEVALVEHGVGVHRGADRGLVAVLLDQELGGAVGVGGGGVCMQASTSAFPNAVRIM